MKLKGFEDGSIDTGPSPPTDLPASRGEIQQPQLSYKGYQQQQSMNWTTANRQESPRQQHPRYSMPPHDYDGSRNHQSHDLQPATMPHSGHRPSHDQAHYSMHGVQGNVWSFLEQMVHPFFLASNNIYCHKLLIATSEAVVSVPLLR